MKTGYIVMYGADCGMHNSNIKGVFLDEDTANEAANGFGFLGSNGQVIPINVFESSEDYAKYLNK